MKTILVVDDDENLREFIGDELRSMNWNVILAQDGLQALQILKLVPVDVIITDIRLPKMTGVELIQSVSKLDDAPKIYVMSGYSSTPPSEYIRAGVRGFFLKPFLVSTFLDHLASEQD